MNKFDNYYNQILSNIQVDNTILSIDQLYDISAKIIEEDQLSYMQYQYDQHPNRYISFEFPVICETTYFQQWDVNDSCVNVVNNILNKILKKYKQTR